MGIKISLCVVTTHPIQYQVPWFRAVDDQKPVSVKVHYESLPDKESQGRGFGTAFSWDLPLLQGYEWSVSGAEGKAGEDIVTESLYDAIRSADVVLVTGWHEPFLVKATLIARFLGIPVLVRGESNALKKRPWYKSLFHRVYLSLFSRYLSIGSSSEAFYLRHGVSSERIHSCRYFVDNSRFDREYREKKKERPALRRKFDVPEGATSFLFAGKFVEKKHPGDVLLALERVRPLPVHGLFVGDGPLSSQLHERASGTDVPVTFTGFLNQTEIGKAYTAADVIVLPSDYGETWGLVINEAMIFECPALVSDRVGCGPDLVGDGETGYTIPFGDTKVLARHMRRMVENPANRERMGERARERVLSHYSVEQAVEGTVEAIQAATVS